MSKSWSGGSTSRWRRKRLYILNRDKWVCQICYDPIDPTLKGPHPRAAHVHHTRGKKATGDEDERFLVSAHGECNLRAGDPTRDPDPPPTPVTRW